jgi:hypothetical protein
MQIFLRQVLPFCAAPQNPENPFQHPPVLDPRTATFAVLGRLGKQGRDLLPLRFGQQRSRPCHRPSLGATDSAYPSFPRTQPPLFQSLVRSYATASSGFRNTKSTGDPLDKPSELVLPHYLASNTQFASCGRSNMPAKIPRNPKSVLRLAGPLKVEVSRRSD